MATQPTDKIPTISLERGWAILLKDLGIRADDVLRRARLPVDLLTRDHPKLSVDDYFRLWHALDAESGDAALPLRIGQAISPEAFHPPIFAAFCSPNLRIAAGRIATYKRLLAPMTMRVESRPEGFFVGPRWDDPAIELPISLAATELVFLVQLARLGTRETIRPLRVVSSVPMDPAADYEAFFGVAPTRGDAHGVFFDPVDADRPFLTASEAMWETFEPELRRRLAELDATASTAERVRSVLIESLPSGEASIESTARRLGLSARTLQRRLGPEGTSFKDIVRETRERLAHHYLTRTSLTYGEISFLIGFNEPSSFFRAFRQWTGSTPESVRFAAAPATTH